MELIYTDHRGNKFYLETYQRNDGLEVFAVFGPKTQETPFVFNKVAAICDFFVQFL